MRFLIAVALILLLLLIANCQNETGINPTNWQDYYRNVTNNKLGDNPWHSIVSGIVYPNNKAVGTVVWVKDHPSFYDTVSGMGGYGYSICIDSLEQGDHRCYARNYIMGKDSLETWTGMSAWWTRHDTCEQFYDKHITIQPIQNTNGAGDW